MDAKLIHPAINVILLEMQKRLDNAASIAAAAVACSQANQIEKAVEVALGVEQATYEASRLLDAASLLNRLSRR
jgi:hypothetical protein